MIPPFPLCHPPATGRRLVSRGSAALAVLVLLLSARFAYADGSQPSSAPAQSHAGPEPRGSVVVAAPSAASAGAGDYRLAPRDLVQFQISDEPEPPAVQRVSASGEIAVPLLGPVRVGGLTLREAEQMLGRQYVDRGFFVKPQVILSLQTYAPRSVSVLGQVNRPDQIEFPVECEHMSLVQAITAAGGFTRIARTDAVRVNRRTGENDRSITVNVDLLLGAKNPAEAADFQLLAGDVVFVPERTF